MNAYRLALASAASEIHLLLNLRHPFHLDVKLGVDVVEMGHHHVEHVIFVQRPRETLRPPLARLADFSPAPDGSGPSARPLRASCADVPSLTLWSHRAPCPFRSSWTPRVLTPRHASLHQFDRLPETVSTVKVNRMRTASNRPRGWPLSWGLSCATKSESVGCGALAIVFIGVDQEHPRSRNCDYQSSIPGRLFGLRGTGLRDCQLGQFGFAISSATGYSPRTSPDAARVHPSASWKPVVRVAPSSRSSALDRVRPSPPDPVHSGMSA